jgi:hypothetical protein
MEVSLFLAKALGLYLTIIAAGMLLNGKHLKPMLLALLKDPSQVLMTGFLALIIGILIVVSHNVWVMGWPVLITILGWLSLFKGVVRLLAPEFVVKKTAMFVENNLAYNMAMLLTFIIGGLLLYYGYIHN